MKTPSFYVPWLAAAALLVIIFGSLYAVVQQAERTGANFPQVQIAEDIATALNQGAKPSSFTLAHVDMASSLAPFVIIFDQSGKLVGSSGYLAGQVPLPPAGMLEAARGQDYHAVTWEPERGVRLAAVTVAANQDYVLSGRNLREVEKDENLTFWRAFAAGSVSWLVLGGAFVLTYQSKWRPSASH